ncbi:hypothetical protein JDV09_25755 [Mycobacterium sp. Y57]|uniref:hypothetical protein n=1 Tax=Mycolicibacterium xanthum TaxID=2796469 RepID=UPI001C8535CC|nr:hypothetical protein [Mycolicibacterium xanthum]MBX7435472.1 hypothetical protein [Mycolicibacterium xanthum]
MRTHTPRIRAIARILAAIFVGCDRHTSLVGCTLVVLGIAVSMLGDWQRSE